jgi:hypothetical protein
LIRPFGLNTLPIPTTPWPIWPGPTWPNRSYATEWSVKLKSFNATFLKCFNSKSTHCLFNVAKMFFWKTRANAVLWKMTPVHNLLCTWSIIDMSSSFLCLMTHPPFQALRVRTPGMSPVMPLNIYYYFHLFDLSSVIHWMIPKNMQSFLYFNWDNARKANETIIYIISMR